MSPTRAASGLVREKRRVRAPEGSRRGSWWVVKRVRMGDLQSVVGEGGGG